MCIRDRACAASKMRSSHVLAAMGAPAEVAAGSLRITLGRPTTEADVDYAAAAIARAVRAEAARVGRREGASGNIGTARAAAARTGSASASVPVSYTHLDVYKRQRLV